MSTPDASGKISYSRTHYNKWCCLHTGYGAARQSLTLNWCLGLVMTYWHKVKMIYNGRFVASSVELLRCEPRDGRPVSEAESKNAYAPSYFLHLAFEWTAPAWVCATSSMAFLFPFTNRSISHSKLRPLAVYSFIYFLFLLMARTPPCNTRAPPPPPPGWARPTLWEPLV